MGNSASVGSVAKARIRNPGEDSDRHCQTGPRTQPRVPNYRSLPSPVSRNEPGRLQWPRRAEKQAPRWLGRGLRPAIPVDDIRLEPRLARWASRVVTGGHFACRWPPCSVSGQRGKAAATSERRPHRMRPSTRQPASARCGRPARKDSKSTTGLSSTSWRIPGIQHKLAASAKATSVAQMARVRRRRRLGSAGRTSIRSAQVKRWDADLAGAQRRAAAMPLRRSNVGMTLRRSNVRKPSLLRHISGSI